MQDAVQIRSYVRMYVTGEIDGDLISQLKHDLMLFCQTNNSALMLKVKKFCGFASVSKTPYIWLALYSKTIPLFGCY